MRDMKQIQQTFERTGLGPVSPAAFAGGALPTTEIGRRTTQSRAMLLRQQMIFIDFSLRKSITDIREMDRVDGRVKKIHSRMARDIVRGGIRLKMQKDNRRIRKLWEDFHRRLQLDNTMKLHSDARGLVMEGNLPLQWVLDADGQHVVNSVRMPSETIRPLVDETGRFKDPGHAYDQIEFYGGRVIASFPLWQLTIARLNPGNWDDLGEAGRPYLDASRSVWRKLVMTEEDLVIRRRERAPLRTAHVLEGAGTEELLEYQERVENEQKDITTNYYLNKKGGVQAVQGDANLDQINDVEHLLETFFSGAPAPAGLFGYASNLNRDILEDLKKDYYEEVDSGQESLEWGYTVGFELELLLNGIDPTAYDWCIEFAERRTETPNQQADRALKLQVIGASRTTVLETAGLDPAKEIELKQNESDALDPYPNDPTADSKGKPSVKITPGNQPKGESQTTVGNK